MSNEDRMNKIEELKSLREQLLEYKRAMEEDDDGNSEASHVKQEVIISKNLILTIRILLRVEMN